MTAATERPWAEIARRASEAEGPDREIDGLVALQLGWTHAKMKGDRNPYWRKPGVVAFYARSELPPYTGSVDAILELIAEKLPGTSWQINASGFGGSWARLHDPMKQPGFGADYPRADAASPALALTAAFALAMDAQPRPVDAGGTHA